MLPANNPMVASAETIACGCVAFAFLGGFVVACGAQQVPRERTTGGPERPPVVAPQSSDAGSDAAPRPPAPRALPVGCYSAEAARARDPVTLDRLAASCVAGMDALLEPAAPLELVAGQAGEVPLSVTDARKCLRAIAVGDAGVLELELSLLDRFGTRIAHDTLGAPFALLERAGTVCLTGAGQYLLVVTMRRGAGQVTLGVWQAR